MLLGRGYVWEEVSPIGTVGSLPTAGFDSLARPGGLPGAGMTPPGSALPTPLSKTCPSRAPKSQPPKPSREETAMSGHLPASCSREGGMLSRWW